MQKNDAFRTQKNVVPNPVKPHCFQVFDYVKSHCFQVFDCVKSHCLFPSIWLCQITLFQSIWLCQIVALSGQFGSQGALPLCYLSEYYVWFSQRYAPLGSRTIILYSSSVKQWTVQAAAGHKSSGDARRWWMAASGRAGGCSGAPPVVVQVPLSGFNWKHNPGKN